MKRTKCMKREDSICGGYDITLKKRVYCDDCKKEIEVSQTKPKT